MEQMKTLTIQNEPFEVVDGAVRKTAIKSAMELFGMPTLDPTYTNGYYAISNPTTFISHNSYRTAEVSVEGGDVINASLKIGASTELAGIMAYYDSSNFYGYVLQGQNGSQTTITSYDYIVPEGVTLLRITSVSSYPTIKKCGSVNIITSEVESNADKWRLKLENLTNAAYFRMSDNVYVKYTSQTPTYGVYEPIPILETLSSVHIVCTAVNTVCAKLAFLNSSALSTNSVVELWSNSTVGEFDVAIPNGAKYICVANECDTNGVVQGNPTVTFTLQEVYNGVIANEQSINSISKSVYDSLIYTDRFNSQRRDSLINTIAKLKTGTLNYTVLGDSITDTWDGHAHAGGGASDSAHGYAKIVYRWLKQKYGNSIQFTNNGTGGITVTGTMDVVDDYIENQGYDLCIIELGTNDWNVQTSIPTFKTNYKALLDTILAYDDAPEIFIIGLGYFGNWHSERAIKEKQYNDALREIAKEYDIPFADPYDGMKEEVDFGTYTFADITYEADPVHPNDVGHRIWANEVYNVFAEIMK